MCSISLDPSSLSLSHTHTHTHTLDIIQDFMNRVSCKEYCFGHDGFKNVEFDFQFLHLRIFEKTQIFLKKLKCSTNREPALEQDRLRRLI